MAANKIRRCEICGKKFEASYVGHGKGLSKYCSKRCRRESISNQRRVNHQPNVVCAQCGKKFYKMPSRIKASKSGLHFCCRKCKDTGQRIESGLSEIHPPHYACGQRTYRTRALREHKHECLDCGWAEVPSVLEVHHIDNNRDNNTIENLVILCPTCHRIRHI